MRKHLNTKAQYLYDQKVVGYQELQNMTDEDIDARFEQLMDEWRDGKSDYIASWELR